MSCSSALNAPSINSCVGAVVMPIEIFDKATIVKSFWTSAIFVKSPTLSIKDLFYNAIFPINGLFYKTIFPISPIS